MIKKKLFWNTFIRSSLQAYIKVLVVYLSMALVLEFSSFSSSLSSIVVILVLSTLILLPIFYTAILSKNREVLHESVIKDKIGSLYLGIKVKSSQQYLYSILFLVRRLIYGAMLISLQNMPVFFSMGLIQLNMMYLYYLGAVQPNDSKTSFVQEISNEVLLQVISYHILITCYRIYYKEFTDDSNEAAENKDTILFDKKVG